MSIQSTSVCVNLLTCIYLEQGGVNEQHKGKKRSQQSNLQGFI